ncbi:hypothetical protein RND81_05G054900 [Saponaria officinalis]|uniref:Uncharacterized protein n=1 Tax=Saponaria officinalis TaxID=3572 RepID=A0AAW1KV03_SAPOF
MEGRRIISPEDVVECLMNDATIDSLRLKIINHLKSNVTFLLFLLILRAPVLEKASKSVWDLILDDSGLRKEISETVERVFCRLSGREPPLFPASTSEGQQQPQQQKEQDENQGSGAKKRTFSEMAEGVENTVNGSADQLAAILGVFLPASVRTQKLSISTGLLLIVKCT